MFNPDPFTERELALRKKFKESFEVYAPACLKIRTKAGEIAPSFMVITTPPLAMTPPSGSSHCLIPVLLRLPYGEIFNDAPGG